MKKLLSLAIALLFCLGLSAQVFEGTYKDFFNNKWESNQDQIVENFKKNVDNNHDIPAASKAMAKMMAKTLVKNYLAQFEVSKYTTMYPDGKYTCYMWVDGPNNRVAAFCPELGRVVVRFPSEGKDYVIFPKLGIGCEMPYAANNSIKDLFTTNHIQDPKKDAKQINGVNCIPAFALFSYENVGGEMKDTITYNGVLCVKMEADGYVHADYQMLPIQRNVANEFVTTSENIRNFTATKVDPKNFDIPKDGIKFVDSKKLIKEVKGIVDDGEVGEKMAISYEGEVPAVVWDIVKK